MNITFRLAWRNLWRQPRRTWLTTGAMVFSNVILVFLISLQLAQYRMMIDNSLRAFTGHLQVQAEGYKDDLKMRQVVPGIVGLADDVRAATGLETVAARAMAFALVSSEERSYGVQVVGVQPRYEKVVSSLPGLVRDGRYLDGPTAAEIVIGRTLARNLRANVGDELTLLGSGRDGSFAAGVVTIAGVFESGSPDMDRGFAAVPLLYFQDTFTMDGAGHSIVIMAPGLLDVPRLQAEIGAMLPAAEPLVVHDWMTLEPGLKQAIQADFASAWFMYGVLIVLVAFSVLNTQLMSVLERTREFGIVMSLGLTPGRLGRLVFLETALMGLVGMLLGMLLGAVLIAWLSRVGFTLPGMEEMTAKFNLPSRMYPQLSFVGLVFGPLMVFAASIVASVYPALRLHWLKPVDAMRAA